MTRTDAISKIRRLLRLGNDSAATRDEAELALSRAMHLSREYHIDAAALADNDEDEEPIIHRRIEVGLRFSLNRQLAASTAATFFSVEAVLSGPDVVFIGTATDIEIASYVFDYCACVASRSLSKWTNGRRLSTSTRASYLHGFYFGILRTLEAQRQDAFASTNGTWALTVIDQLSKRRREYKDKMFPPSTLKDVARQRRRMNNKARFDGYVDGKSVTIRTPITYHCSQDNPRLESRLALDTPRSEEAQAMHS